MCGVLVHLRRDSQAVRQRTANPSRSVRLRFAPPSFKRSVITGRFFVFVFVVLQNAIFRGGLGEFSLHIEFVLSCFFKGCYARLVLQP